MASGTTPILGVWVCEEDKAKPVEIVSQWVDLAVALGSIVTSVQTKRNDRYRSATQGIRHL